MTTLPRSEEIGRVVRPCPSMSLGVLQDFSLGVAHDAFIDHPVHVPVREELVDDLGIDFLGYIRRLVVNVKGHPDLHFLLPCLDFTNTCRRQANTITKFATLPVARSADRAKSFKSLRDPWVGPKSVASTRAIPLRKLSLNFEGGITWFT